MVLRSNKQTIKQNLARVRIGRRRALATNCPNPNLAEGQSRVHLPRSLDRSGGWDGMSSSSAHSTPLCPIVFPSLVHLSFSLTNLSHSFLLSLPHKSLTPLSSFSNSHIFLKNLSLSFHLYLTHTSSSQSSHLSLYSQI